jgi:hypothetical protein
VGSPGGIPGAIRPVVNRPKRATPETETIQRFKPVARSRGDVVSGRRAKGLRPETARLMRSAEQAGATLKKAKHGYLVKKDGEVVAGIPTTPSDHRSTKNSKAKLKRAGIAT